MILIKQSSDNTYIVIVLPQFFNLKRPILVIGLSIKIIILPIDKINEPRCTGKDAKTSSKSTLIKKKFLLIPKIIKANPINMFKKAICFTVFFLESVLLTLLLYRLKCLPIVWRVPRFYLHFFSLIVGTFVRRFNQS